MKWIPIVVMIYGIILWVGGMIGYAKAHSLVSFIMGSVSAAMLVVAGITMLRPTPWGFWWAVCVTGLLAAFFAYRYYITQKLMPAGMLTILSLLVLCLLITFAKLWIKK